MKPIQTPSSSADPLLDSDTKVNRFKEMLMGERPWSVSNVFQLLSFPPIRDGDVLLSLGADWETGLSAFVKKLRPKVDFTWVQGVYDVAAIRRPYLAPPGFAHNLADFFLNVASGADKVWFPSRHSLNEFEKLFNSDMKEGQVRRVVPLASSKIIARADPNYDSGTGDEKPQGIDGMQRFLGPYILAVGTVEVRKNYSSLVSAYKLLQSEGRLSIAPALLIAGRRGWRTDDLQEIVSLDPELSSRIFFLGDVDDQELFQLYKGASGFIQASEEEGFALPIADALDFQLDIALADISIFQELYPSTRKFNPFDTRVISQIVLDFGTSSSSPKGMPLNRQWCDVVNEISDLCK